METLCAAHGVRLYNRLDPEDPDTWRTLIPAREREEVGCKRHLKPTLQAG